VDSSKAGSDPITDAKSPSSPVTSPGRASPGGPNGIGSKARTSPPGSTQPRKLIAYQLYFGIEARAFHAGAQRMLKRASAQASGQTWINIRTLSEDFKLDLAASGTLLRAFLTGGLLYPDGDGGYEATERFRQYALTRVVLPLMRSEAKDLLHRACSFAAGFNADSQRQPLLIETMMVSGSYITRCDLVPELSLWLILRRRRQPDGQHSTPSFDKDDSVRHLKEKMKELGPIVEVHIAPDRDKVARPFSVVFQRKDVVIEPPPRAWDKLRDWSASIGHRVASGKIATAPAAKRSGAESLPQAPAELVTVQRGPRTLQRERSAWGTVGKRN